MPQPQDAVTLGFLILNWAPIRLVDEVDLAALHEVERDGIDHHARAVALDQEVVGRLIIDQVEAVLEARAAAALDAHAEQGRGRLVAQKLDDPVRRSRAQGDGRFAHVRCSQSSA